MWIIYTRTSYVLKRNRCYNTVCDSHPQCDCLCPGVLQWVSVEFGMGFTWLVLALDTILPSQILVFLERRVETLPGHIEFFCAVQVQKHWDKAPLCLSAALPGKLPVRVTHSLNKLNFSYRRNGCFQDKNEMVKAEILTRFKRKLYK